MTFYTHISEDRVHWHTPVIDSVEDFRGWEMTDCTLFKPGVYRVGIERATSGGRERINCVSRIAMVTTAIELGILTRR
jgi:hypothetical protein